MKTLGITIKFVVEVQDEMAAKFDKCPPGFLMIGGEALGSEELTVRVVNEEPITPVAMNVRLQELSPNQRESFISDR